MSRQVQVLFPGVTLPNGNTYFDVNTVVTLTDQQFASINPAAFTSGKLLDLGSSITLTPVAGVVSTNADNGGAFRTTLVANSTIANPTNLKDGQLIRWAVTQGAGAPWTVALGSMFNLGPMTLTWSTVAGKVDYLGVAYRAGTNKLDVIAFSAGY